MQDKDLADKSKSGIDNLAKAIALDAKDGSGWDAVAGVANEPTAMELPQQKGVILRAGDPTIDPNAFEALGNATGTDPSEWGYPNKDGLEVHAAAQPNAPVIEKARPESGARAARHRAASDPNQPLFLHVATPSGKTGYVDAQIARAARRRPDVLHQGCGRLENCRLFRRRLAAMRIGLEAVLNRRRVRGTMATW